MIIGVPREIKVCEYRVGLTPSAVMALVERGHKVLVEKGAGQGSGISDEEFSRSGAQIIDQKQDLFAQADMIVKVKEPLPEEFNLFRENQILFTYLHLAADRRLTESLCKKGIIGIAYETVQRDDGFLPLLAPMSEVAGRMSVLMGAYYLAKQNGGLGTLIPGVPGVTPAKILILGGGVVGTNAAKMAAGMRAQVTVMDVNVERLRYLDDILPNNVVTEISTSYTIEKELPQTDLLIGAVLIPGARAPRLLTREMLGLMKKGAVVVDVAVDQGGCLETTRATSWNEPTYEVEGVIHYCVANMPGAYPHTSTFALVNVTLPYCLAIANQGWEKAVTNDPALARGVNLVGGKVVCEGVARAHNLACYSIKEAGG